MPSMRLPARRTLWLSAVVIVVIVIAMACLFGGRGISQTNFERIQPGMSEAEVTAILGEPSLVINYGFFADTMIWNGAAGTIWISPDEHGKVLVKTFTPRTTSEQIKWLANQWLEKIGVSWN
jgi:hypothetical protein